MIYLDHNATTFYSPSVRKFVQDEMLDLWANPSSEHALGAELSDKIKLMRADIGESLGCSAKGLVFTSGATESINTVLSLDNLENLGVKRIVSSPMEHHATLDRLKHLSKKGFEIEFLRNDENGILDLEGLDKLLSVGTKTLVTLLFANNETGAINPIKEIGSIVRKYDHLFHVDGVQALGKIKFSLEDLDVDFMSFSGHKIGAFKGIGLLYAADIKSLSPLLHGGGQERGYRPGTINFPSIKSFHLATSDLSNWDNILMEKLRDSLELTLKSSFKVEVNCEKSLRLCNTSNIYFPSMPSRELMNKLSRVNIFTSTGSACSSGSFEPSHVIRALGKNPQFAEKCLRVSLGPLTTKDDLDSFVNTLGDTL